MSWGIKSIGLKELIRRLRDKGKVENEIADGLDDIAYVGYTLLRDHAPRKTGTLAESHFYRSPDKYTRHLLSGAKHGRYVREGVRGPYPIYPKTKKALWWPGLGQPIAFVGAHPGQKANPYHEKAANDLVTNQAKYLPGIAHKIAVRIVS